MSGRRPGDTFNTVRPYGDLACFFRRHMAHDLLRIAKVATDPARAILAPRNHNSMLIDDPHDAAARKPVQPERLLEMFQLGADNDDGP